MADSVHVQSPEIISVPEACDGVLCEGGGGAFGHPKVWYSFEDRDSVECSYCNRLFVKERA